MLVTYSRVSNNRGASNKCMVAYKFFTLLHKIARFGPFLANFSLKINNGGATIIRYSRVVVVDAIFTFLINRKKCVIYALDYSPTREWRTND